MSSLRPLCLLVSLDSLRLPLPVSAAFLDCDRGSRCIPWPFRAGTHAWRARHDSAPATRREREELARSRKNDSDPRSGSQTRIRAHHGPHHRCAICAADTDGCDARQHSQHNARRAYSLHTDSALLLAPTTANDYHTHIHPCKTVLQAPHDVALTPGPLEAASLRY
ncbi:hypothetical protein VTO73DRAFT_15587 [Trametes versicolor]